MKVTGKYKVDHDFITLYSDNAMYTIARNTGEWGCLKVGDTSATGHTLTQEQYNMWCMQCTKEGTFNLR